MADVSGKFFSAKKVRTGVSPSSPGVIVGETLPPVNPPGGGLNSVGLTMPAAFAVANSPLTSNGTIEVTGAGTTAEYVRGDGSLATFPALTGFVPYTGATADVNLGTHDLTAERGTFENNGSSDTLTVNHTSGSGYGIEVTKGGNNEALYVNKTSGSGNAMAVVGGRTSLVDLALSSVTNTAGDFLTISGGVVHKRTSSEVRTDIGAGTGNGTVTSVAALTLGTTGTDLTSTVANGTTTPVITLNVPTASAANRGALSAADWTTFNNKQNALTNPVTGTGTSGQVAYFNGTTTITSESNLFWDATNDRLGIGTTSPSSILHIESALGSTGNALRLQNTTAATTGNRLDMDFWFKSVAWTNARTAQISAVTTDTYFPNTDIVFSNHNGTSAIGVTERMRITSGGNVLIGTTTDAGFKLDVNGTGRFSGTLTGTTAVFSNTVTGIQGTFTDGFQGLIIGYYTGGTGYGAIYASTLTPNMSNYALIAKSDNTIVNAPTGGSVNVSIGNTIALTVDSSRNAQLLGNFSLRAAASASVTTQIPVFVANPASTTRELVTRTPAQFRSDIGAGTVGGTGTAGQVAYWSSGSQITGESNLFYNATNDRLGILTNTPNSSLQVNGSVSTSHTTKTANYTLTESDYTVGFDCASNRTATLPDATTCQGRIYVIYHYNTGSLGERYVTLDGNGSQTINGLTTYSLQYTYDFSSVMIQSNGSNWIIISDSIYFAPV